jgi:hypothetical protein
VSSKLVAIQIEFWTVRRQIVQVQSAPGALASLLVHNLAFVNSGTIDQDNAWHRVRLRRYLVEKSDHIVASGRPLLRRPDQRAVVAQCPKHVDTLSMRQRLD